MLLDSLDVLGAVLASALPFTDIDGAGHSDERSAAVCGDDEAKGKEQCDGFDLDGNNCRDADRKVFAGGFLGCTEDCQFDVSECHSGDCCESRDITECDVPAITKCVCKLDSFCCEVAWDSLCVEEAVDDCGAVCIDPG